MTSNIEAMARKLLRYELTARGARDVDIAEAYIARITRFDPDLGDYVGTVDHSGTPLIAHQRDSAPYMNIDEVLAETMKSKPELFGGKSQTSGRVSATPAYNPFAQGPHFNMTEAMILTKEDPELASAMALEAGFDLRNIR